MRYLWAAVTFLTLFRWNRVPLPTPEETAKATPIFPVIGFGLGVVLILFNFLLEPYLASEILSVVLVIVLILLTGGRQLEGLQETFDRLGTHHQGRNGQDRSEKSRTAVFGVLAVLAVVALKFRTIEVMGEVRTQGLLLAPALSRWGMVVLAYGPDPASEGKGRMPAEYIRGWHLSLATALTLVFMAVFSGRLGLWVALWISLFTLLSKKYLHHRLLRIEPESIGAVAEISEALALVLFASLY